MFPEPVEASIDLLLHLFHRFRRRVPDLLFDIAVAVLFRIQFRRIGRKPFDTDLSFRRQTLFHYSRAMGLRSVPYHYQWLPEAAVADGATFLTLVARESPRGNDAY